MPDEPLKSVDQAPDDQAKPQDARTRELELLLRSFAEQTFHEFSRFRFAEEREWYESALFYQRRQWLRWNNSTRRHELVKQNPSKPKPMPVSNYFAKAINANANNLALPTITAVPGDDDPRNRRAADYAEKAAPAVDRESGMDVLCPVLAKHAVLWGLGITKDVMDTTAASGRVAVPNPTLKVRSKIACSDCGKTSGVADKTSAPSGPAGNMVEDADQTTPAGQGGPVGNETEEDEIELGSQKAIKCPACGSDNAVSYPELQLVPAGTKVYTKGKITTHIVPVFEVYLPRKCGHASLAKRIVHRFRQSLGELRRMYGDVAKGIKSEGPQDVHQIYMEALRALVNYNYMHEQALDETTVTEMWSQWEEVPQRVQQKITDYWAEEPDKLEQAQNDGIFMIYAGGKMLAWGPNFLEGQTPFTFFAWEVDPANVYPKGLAVDVTPLQKRLNRLDSLIELAVMTNGVGKWLWPTTQNTKPPTGSPSDVVEYDPIGDAKIKPEFVAATPFGPILAAVRQSILADFDALGNQLGVQQGAVPKGGPKSFRGQAYLGAKAEEAINTQRTLWETAHRIRYNKVLKMAKMLWDEPRSTRVAGFNGKFGMMQLKGDDLNGEFELDMVPDSSRPKSPAEKKEAFGMLASGNMVDLTDPQTRDFVVNMSALDEVNLAGHLQYVKADRDLDKLRNGQVPMPSPFQDPTVLIKILSEFTLTEEFENSPPGVQQLIVTYAQAAQQKMQQAQQQQIVQAEMLAKLGQEFATKGDVKYLDPSKGAGGAPNPHGMAEHIKGKGNELNKVPGQTASPTGVEHAAHAQGNVVREQHA